MSETPQEPQHEGDERPDEEGSPADADKGGTSGKDEVQEQSEESFPASDPPSF